MNLSEIYWREPLWFICLLFPVFLMVINRWWQQRQLMLFADIKLIPWLTLPALNQPKRLPLLCLLLGWLLLCIALAGPRTVKQLPPTYQPEASMLVVIMDLSASMYARDIRPDRRSVAQRLLANWLSQKPDSLEVSVILFAGHTFKLFPATKDKVVISHFINSLEDVYLPTAGNNLSAAIRLAVEMLQTSQNERRLLVLTDGDIEFSEQKNVSKLFSNQWEASKIKTSFVGFGQSKPVTVPNRLNGLVEDQGRAVLSRMESAWLEALTMNPVIDYFHYQQASSLKLGTIVNISEQRLNDETQQQVIWLEWFQFPLLTGLFFLVLAVIFNNKGRLQSGLNLLSLVFFVSIFIGYNLSGSVAHANDSDILSQAQQALDRKQYVKAQKLFNELETVNGYFGLGIACYRVKDYLCAQQAFSSAAWKTKDKLKRAKAVFNLANSYFFLANYDQAIVLYQNAKILGVAPDLIAVNLEYAKSMQASIQRHLHHLQQSYKRALWKAAVVGEQAPSLSEFVFSNDSYLSVLNDNNLQQTQYRLPAESIQQEIIRQLGITNKSAQDLSTKWIETDRVLPRSTAKLLNRLFEMELGIGSSLKQPQVVEGKRKW